MNTRTQLRLYAAGLLDPDDASDLEDRLASSSALRRALAALQPAPVEAPPPSPWRMPPPGWGTALQLQTPPVLGPGKVRSGDAFHVHVEELPDALEREVVVLRKRADSWEVIAPQQPEDRSRLSDFPLAAGRRRITLLARGAGLQRWSVALPRWEPWLPDHPTEARWDALRQAIGAGAVPVGTVDLEVMTQRTQRAATLPLANTTYDSLSGELAGGAAPKLLAGRYELQEALGRGGNGEVWRAFDRISRVRVAIKLIAATEDADLVQIRRELTALRWLQLPGVARLRDDGIDGPRYFLVMDLVEGGLFPGLAAPASWSALKQPALALLESLARVHQAGVVHRDLKPQNVLMSASGLPVIVDFGLAVGAALSPTAERAGLTLRYAAPEQFNIKLYTARTDLYSLGVMLYEALSGRLPHEDSDRHSLVHARLNQAPRSLGTLRPDLPWHVIRTIDQMLATDPADRPASALEVLGALGGDGHGLVWGEALNGLPKERRATADELKALFQGPDLFLHLAEDGAAALWRRTGGHPERVNREVAAWVRAGLARWEQGALVVSRRAVDQLSTGLAVDLASPDEALGLSADDSKALAWVRFGFPEVTADGLALAADLSAAEAVAALDRLERAGLVWPLGDGTWGAQPGLGAEAPTADLGRVLQIFSERSEAQVSALSAMHLPLHALLPRIQRLGEHLLSEGRLAAAAAALDQGLWMLRREAPGDSALLDMEAELLRLVCIAALSEESVPAFDRALYALGRAVGGGDDLEAMGWLLQGVRASFRREPERALALLDAMPPQADEELETWRQAARTRAAAALGTIAEEEMLERLSPWAAGSTARQARLAGWYGNLRYRQGRYEESARLHQRSAAGKSRPDACLSSLVNAAGASMDALRYDDARQLALQVKAVARQIGHAANEAMAYAILRQVAYRQGQATAAQPELVEAASAINGYEEGLFALTEAAVAWRCGDRALGLSLAERACGRFTANRHPEGARLCTALALACRGDAPADELRALAEEAATGQLPGLVAQTIGLVNLALPEPDPALTRLAMSAAHGRPEAQWGQRLEVLSLDEAVGRAPHLLEPPLLEKKA